MKTNKKHIKRILNALFSVTFIFLLIITKGLSVEATPTNDSPSLKIKLYETNSGNKSFTVEEFKDLYTNNGEYFSLALDIEATSADVEIGVITLNLDFDDTLFELNSTIISAKTGSGINIKDIWVFNKETESPKKISGISNSSKTGNAFETFKAGVTQTVVTNIYFTLVSGKTLDDISESASLNFGLESYEICLDGDNVYNNTNITTETTTVGEVSAEPNPALKSINVLGGATGQIVLDDMTQFSGEYKASIALSYRDSKVPLNISYETMETSGVSVSITGNEATASVPFTSVSPRSEITISVTHGGETRNYILVVNSVEAASTANVLAGLSTYYSTGSNLITSFDGNTLNYTVDVPNSQSSVTIEALIPTSYKATVIINGTTPTKTISGDNDKYSLNIAGLVEGDEKTVSIEVTAEDGTSIKTYHVTIRRANKSSDTALSSLIVKVVGQTNITGVINDSNISALIPEYSSDSINFYFEIYAPSTAKSIRYKIDDGGWITRVPSNGKAVSESITSFPRGTESTIIIEVIAENGTSTRQYEFTLAREKSSNTQIDGVNVKQGTDTTAATRNGTVFTYVSSGTGNFEILPVIPSTESSTYIIRKGSNTGIVVTGLISYSSLSLGDNYYYIIVTAANGSSTAEYSVNLYKRSVDNSLESYDLYDASNTTIISDNWILEGAVYKNTFDWYKESPKISVLIQTSDKSVITLSSGVTFTYENSLKNQVSVTHTFSGTKEESFSFTITVTAEDTTNIKTYNFTIIQKAADTEARLKSITIQGIPVDSFDPDIYYYNTPVVIGRSFTNAQIIATKHDDSNGQVTITYNGNASSLIPITAPGDVISVRIEVTPQSGTADKKTYYIKIVAGDNNNEITNITFSGIDFSYDPSVKSYTITSPASVANTVMTVITPGDYRSKVYIKLNTEDPVQIKEKTISLTPQIEATIQVYVISESGDKSDTYVIKITRSQPKTDKLLDTLVVNLDGNPQTLIPISSPNTPGFNPNIFDYKLRVDYAVKSLNVMATIPNGTGAKIVSGTGQKTLSTTSTSTTITVIVEAEDGSRNEYNIEITRADDDNKINKVIIDTVEYNISEFLGSDTDVYKVLTISKLYPYATKQLSVEILKNNEYATITSGLVSGNWVLVDGKNYLEFYATSQAGTVGQKYRIVLERTSASKNAYLDSLAIKDDSNTTLDIRFDKTKLTYSYRVDNTVELITISTTLPLGASVTGDLGTLLLNVNANIFKITVTAEDGVTKNTYTITIYRSNDRKDVNDVLVDNESLIDVDSNPFDQAKLSYNLGTIPYAKSSIKIGVLLADSSSVVTINGQVSSQSNVTLNVGTNTILIVVKSQYENVINGAGTTYTITIIRSEASNNNTLTGITVNGIDVVDFDKTVSKIVYLPSGTTLAKIVVQGKHETATITYDGLSDDTIVLSGSTKKTVIVKVTAENGSFKNYYVNIQAANTDNTISNIVLSGIDSSLFSFNSDVKAYTIEVPFSLTSTTVTAYVPTGSKSVVTGAGTHTLTANNSYKIIVYATSEAGIEGEHYEITITRLPASSDTNISLLQIYKGKTASAINALLDESKFDSDENSYEIRVNNDIKDILIVATKANREVISGVGIKALALGVNTYTITITAEDGLTVRTINIKITRANDNNTITGVIIDGTGTVITPSGDIDEIILSDTSNPIPFSTKTIDITGMLEDSSAKIYIDGRLGTTLTYSLKEGQNSIIIYAISEYGTKSREIHISYYRTAAASDTSLDGLTVETETGTIINFDGATFDPSKQDYIITLGDADNYQKVNIIASGENLPYKKVTGQIGLQNLNWSGESINQKLVITVTAENGSTRTYSISFLKNATLGSNKGIKTFTVTDTDGKSYIDFLDDNVLNKGSIKLPYEISTLIFNLETIDKNAIIEWENGQLGYNTFAPGSTTKVFFQVIAQDGSKGTKYYLEITRDSANAKIASVKVDDKEIDLSLFIKDGRGIYVYQLTNVLYPKDFIDLKITTEDSKAIITGGGIKLLSLGTNKFSFYATAQDGITISDKYEIVVIKESRTENELDNLYVIIEGKKILIDPILDVNKIIVAKTVTSIIIGGNLPGGATTDGFKEYLLSNDNQTIEIKVKSEAGTEKVYKIEVQRKSNNTNIASIMIDDEAVDISEFVNKVLYLPNVTWSKKNINLQVTLEDVNAKVNGNGLINLTTGHNAIKFYVIAEDGSIGNEYSIIVYREQVSNDATLKDLYVEVDGVKVNFTKGLFSPSVLTYNLTINRNKAITITAVKNHLNASVGGDFGLIAVEEITQGGNTEFRIHVTAEDGTTKIIYKINVEAKSNIAKINDLMITDSNNTALPINFNNTDYSYTLNDVIYSNNLIKVAGSIADTYARLVVLDSTGKVVDANHLPLVIGDNDFIVYALAEDGVTKSDEYQIRVKRLDPDSNNLLSSLSVTKTNASGPVLPFDEVIFDASNNHYSIYIQKTDAITNLYIHATAQSSKATITGDKLFVLSTGDTNLIQVVVTAESGETNIYFITVVRGGTQDNSSDASVLEVKLLDSKANNYLTGFNKAIANQNPISVPYNVSSIVLLVTSYPNATIVGNGTYELEPGIPQTITFQVTSPDGNHVSLLYSIIVTRNNPVEDNNLNDLYIDIINSNGNVERVALNPEKLLNEISIGKNATGVTIGGTNINGATITGLGEYTIDSDEKLIKVVVSSPNNDNIEYIIKVYKQSNDTDFLSIEINGKEQLTNFENGVLNLGDLAYSNKTLKIIATAKDEYALVNGDARTITIEYALTKTGIIEYNLFVLAEDGTMGPKYTIRLNRLVANNNANLSGLVVKDNATNNLLLLNPSFDASIYKYSIDLTNQSDVKELLIEGIKASSNATLSGNGTYILKTEQGQSSQIFVITVTAEDGTTINNYEILVTRETTPDDDNTINEISLVGSDSINYLGLNGSGLYNFELSKYDYFISVPYGVKNVTLYISNNNGATPYGIGRHNITNKTTVIEFYMVSKSMNKSNIYSITIIQDDPSSDNSLKDLTVDGKTINNFDPNVLDYTIDVVSEKVKQINLWAITNDPNSLMTGDTGIIELPNGRTQWKINVRAENGDVKTYTINVSCLSGNNTITDISINNKAIELSFDPNKLVYYVTVPYLTTTITLNAYKEHSMATIDGTGLKTLSIGSNYFPVYAIAENGDKGSVYQVEVVREAPSTDSSLKLLEVREYEGGPIIYFNNQFSSTSLNYIINMDEDEQLNSVWINAIANSQYARGVTGSGFKWLKAEVDGLYHTVIEVMVIAEDGITTTTYTISFYRAVELSKVAEVGELALIGSNGIDYLGTDSAALQSFNQNTFEYRIKVPYNMASITLNVAAQPASVYGAGSKSFGSNQTVEFEMYIVSQDGSNQTGTYKIIVEKEAALTSNKLLKLLINEEDMLNFNPDINQYEITLSILKYTNIFISALAEDRSSVITGDIGGQTLIEGTQTFAIVVTAQNGNNRTYTIIVNYVQSNALLEELQINTCDDENYSPETAKLFKGLVFDPVTFEYTLKVEKEVKTINISGAAQDLANALVIGFGTYVIDDEGTKINIFVQSADGKQLEKYVINIIKEDLPSNNSKLKDLKINNGEYKLTFDPNIMSYSITVKNGVSKLNIEAITQDANAIASVTGADQIDVGKNVLMILVQAEDGSVSFYQVSVIRDAAPDYFLLVMLILAFLVWILTIVYILIFSSKRKKGKRPIVI